MAQCQNYCNAAGKAKRHASVQYISPACAAGELVFVDANTNAPRTCTVDVASTCPAGYTCRYDQLNQRSVCCGSDNAGTKGFSFDVTKTPSGVCANNEKAFMDAFTLEARECLPSTSNACRTPYVCKLSHARGKYYCCASQDGSQFNNAAQ